MTRSSAFAAFALVRMVNDPLTIFGKSDWSAFPRTLARFRIPERWTRVPAAQAPEAIGVGKSGRRKPKLGVLQGIA